MMHNMVWIWPVLLGVTCDILDWLNRGGELPSTGGGQSERRCASKYFSCSSSPTVFLLAVMKGGVFGGHGSTILHTHAHTGPTMFKRNELWPLRWKRNKWKEWYVSLFLSLDCGCVHRPPPALPIPLLIIVMSEKRSSGRGCWQEVDWAVVLAHTSKMKRLLLYTAQ